MRALPLVLLALGAGIAGAVVGVVIAGSAGLGGTTTTVRLSVPAPVAADGEEAAPETPAGGGQSAAPAGRFDASDIYARRAPGVVTLYADLPGGGAAQGSGFVVDAGGTILTNAHVITNVGQSEDVRGATRLVVEFPDGQRAPAEIVGWDLFADVGVVRVDAASESLVPLPLGDSDEVVVGAPVAAIGSPFDNPSSLAVGVVSATGRSIPSLTSRYEVADAIQVDAPINRGNSGGPLLDGAGRVIGINAQIRSTSGTAEGVGFAIPINIARRSLEQLERDGAVRYAYIGIKTQDVTPDIAKRFGLGAPRGALIASVESGTPAEEAGLRGGSREEDHLGERVVLGGDLIVKIGDTPVESAVDVSRIVAYGLEPGDRVPFVVVRDGEERTVPVTLGTRPEPSP